MVSVKEMTTIFAGGLALAASFYAYFAIPSIYFPSKDCIMTYLLFPLFILPILHFFHFINYLYRFFSKRDWKYLRILNFIVTMIAYFMALSVYFFYIFPSLQRPPSSSHSPPWFKPSIISRAVTGCLKNSDVCQNLANSQDFSATFQHDPILNACCVRRASVTKRFEEWALAMQNHDQLKATETGYVALGCMEAYVENIRNALEMAVVASYALEPAVFTIFFFLLPAVKNVKRATRAVSAS